ncbi:MAG: hypothetical protein ACREV1_10100 [Gammaproteobacteria bacterium]
MAKSCSSDALARSPPRAPASASGRPPRSASTRYLTTRREAGALFGQERGDGLAGILGAIEQTFDGQPLYPSAWPIRTCPNFRS